METRGKFTERFIQALYKEGRNHRPMKMKDLSERTGLTTRSLTLYKTGRRCPSALSGVRLAHALNVSLDWLLGVSEDSGPDDAVPVRPETQAPPEAVPNAPGPEDC